MASYCRWNVSLTPEVTQPTEAGGHLEFTTLHEDIRKTLGGSGKVEWAETIQDSTWAAGAHTEEVAQATNGNGVATAACDVLFIKHSGFQDVAHTTVSTDNLNIRDNTNPASGNTLFVLAPGESVVIPRPAIAMYMLAASNTVSIEWAELT
jgi:hypothetical protein